MDSVTQHAMLWYYWAHKMLMREKPFSSLYPWLSFHQLWSVVASLSACTMNVTHAEQLIPCIATTTNMQANAHVCLYMSSTTHTSTTYINAHIHSICNDRCTITITVLLLYFLYVHVAPCTHMQVELHVHVYLLLVKAQLTFMVYICMYIGAQLYMKYVPHNCMSPT